MPPISLSVLVQYVVNSAVETHMRPYEVKSELAQSFEVFLNTHATAESNHWKVSIEAHSILRSSEGQVVQKAHCAMEAIAKIEGAEPDEIQAVLKSSVAPALLGSVRSALVSLTSGTGFGAQVLPPVTPGQVAALPMKA